MANPSNTPQEFLSIQQMHICGYFFKSERKEPQLIHKWLDVIKRKNITIGSLANQAGILPQSLYQATNHGKSISLDAALRISLVLDIPVDDLFGYSNGTLYRVCRRNNRTIYIDRLTLKTMADKEATALMAAGRKFYNPETGEVSPKKKPGMVPVIELLCEKVCDIINNDIG